MDMSEADIRPEPVSLLTVAAVARFFGVSPKTVGPRARTGPLAMFRTIGGHHRCRVADIEVFVHREAETCS